MGETEDQGWVDGSGARGCKGCSGVSYKFPQERSGCFWRLLVCPDSSANLWCCCGAEPGFIRYSCLFFFFIRSALSAVHL